MTETLPAPTARRWRSLVAVAVVVATAVGSLWGSDDGWPFAPFRMYATATRLDGTVAKAGFLGITTSGEEILIPAGWLGLRPAEVEGQLLHETRGLPPDLMADLGEAWNESHGPDEQLARLELHLKGSRLEDGVPVERSDRITAVWVAE